MSSLDRRTRARRRAWGRGPAVLRFEPLEGRQLLSISDPIAEIAAVAAADVSATTTTGAEPGAAAIDATVTTTSTDTAASDANLADLAAQSGAAPVTTVSATSSKTLTTTTSSPNAPNTILYTTSPVAAAPATKSNYDGSNLVASAFDTLHNLDWGRLVPRRGDGSQPRLDPHARGV